MPVPLCDAGEEHLSVLFVCTGNICRSPMAEVVLSTLLSRRDFDDGRSVGARVRVRSAGTSDWHAGEPMDRRARAALDAAGFDAQGTAACRATDELLDASSLVVALDRGHRRELRERRPGLEVSLLRHWSDGADLDVFDPYYGDDADFAECLALIVPGCTALADEVTARLVEPPR